MPPPSEPIRPAIRSGLEADRRYRDELRTAEKALQEVARTCPNQRTSNIEPGWHGRTASEVLRAVQTMLADAEEAVTMHEAEAAS